MANRRNRCTSSGTVRKSSSRVKPIRSQAQGRTLRLFGTDLKNKKSIYISLLRTTAYITPRKIKCRSTVQKNNYNQKKKKLKKSLRIQKQNKKKTPRTLAIERHETGGKHVDECNRAPIACVVKELKATNESLKSLQTQLELAYASTASSGAAVAGGCAGLGLGSVSDGAGGGCGTVLGGSVAVPGGVPGSTTLTAIMETKDARIQTLEGQVTLLETELQRIKECGGRLREQLLKATAVPSSGGGGLQQQSQQSSVLLQQQQQQQQQQAQINNNLAAGGIESQARQGLVTAMGGGCSQQPGTLALARGPSVMTSLVPYGHTSSTALTSSLLAGSTGGTMTGVGGGGGSSCLAGISSGATTGVVNPYTDRYADHLHQLHHHYHPLHHHQPHLHHQQQHQLQLQHQQQMQQHLKQIEPAAQGALALHAHNFNKHDMNFKRQVSFFINNVRIEKNDAV
ncbi:uncharacterized protein LOC143362915 [Halictus rubicundus]|uniref:uncharacterized protein LOC143362915 n=1 Tax=Halictus rubicundus TaxID=77578 RepID=UPI0040368BF3